MSAEAWRRTGHLDAAAFCVAGVALSAPQARFGWQVWHFQYLHRCPRKLGDKLGRQIFLKRVQQSVADLKLID